MSEKPERFSYIAPGVYDLSKEEQIFLGYVREDLVPSLQPIETAPKDGSKFLGYWPSNADWEGETNDCYVSTWWTKRGWENPFEAPYEDGETGGPTHWMPLPDAPA